MTVRSIRFFPDPILSQPANTVQDFGPPLAGLVEDLTDTMIASPGVGVAAPQIGVSFRVSVIDVRRSSRKSVLGSHGLIVLINPILLRGENVQIPREGCLSLPDVLANVRRYETITVRTQTVDGNERIFKAQGFEALALQHEIDHLDGKLFIDRVLNLKTDLFRRKSR